jgi:hypothetical protein
MKPYPAAKQKRALKLAFDAAMLLLLALMYRKQAISLTFHEVGGLALTGLVVMHLLFNARWIGAVTKRLFSKSTGIHAHTCYIVDALLLFALLTVGVSGVLISKVVFPFHAAGNFKTLHYFSAALAVILMGVHLGLHADYIFGKLLKKSANKAAKIFLAAVLAAAVLFGGYSLFTSGFVTYLAAPVQAASFSRGTFSPSGDIALDGSAEQRPLDLSELPEDGTEANPGVSDGGGRSGSGVRGNKRSSNVASGYGNDDRSGSLPDALLLIAQYISIITLFAALTYPIMKLLRKRQNGVVAVEEPECERLLDGGEPSAEAPDNNPSDDETQEN